MFRPGILIIIIVLGRLASADAYAARLSRRPRGTTNPPPKPAPRRHRTYTRRSAAERQAERMLIAARVDAGLAPVLIARLLRRRARLELPQSDRCAAGERPDHCRKHTPASTSSRWHERLIPPTEFQCPERTAQGTFLCPALPGTVENLCYTCNQTFSLLFSPTSGPNSAGRWWF